MINAKATFESGIQDAHRLNVLYSYLVNQVKLRHDEVSDLLRLQIVVVVSAMDRFIHELVRIGVIEAFEDRRVRTEKFKTSPIKSISSVELARCSVPGFTPSNPDEIPSNIISKDIFERNKILSFQAPDKVKEALSLIWAEQQKFSILADRMSLPGTTTNDRQKYLTQKLTLIIDRRNQIAHEADVDPISGNRRSISVSDANESVDFIKNLCNAIYVEVTDSSCYTSTV